MRCNTCGMDSKRTDACDFCGTKLGGSATQPGAPQAAQPLGGVPPATPLAGPPIPPPVLGAPPIPPPPPGLTVTQQIPQPPIGQTQAFMPLGGPNTTQAFAPQQPQIRVSLTGEAVAYDPPAGSQPMPPGQGPMYGPPGTPAPRIFNPSAGLPAAAVGTHLASAMTRDKARVSTGAKWETTLAIFLPALALCVFLVKWHPNTYNWVQFIGFFAAGLALGGSGVVPCDAEQFIDWAVVLLVTLLFGPLIALVVYLISGVLRQSWNPAVILLLLGNCLVTFVLSTALVSAAGLFALFGVAMDMFTRFFGVVTTMVGWGFSSFFRPINED